MDFVCKRAPQKFQYFVAYKNGQDRKRPQDKDTEFQGW